MSDDEREQHYEQGQRSAHADTLRHALRNLGYEDVKAETLIAEREGVVAFLRGVCAELGDNDWTPDLNLVEQATMSDARTVHVIGCQHGAYSEREVSVVAVVADNAAATRLVDHLNATSKRLQKEWRASGAPLRQYSLKSQRAEVERRQTAFASVLPETNWSSVSISDNEATLFYCDEVAIVERLEGRG